MRTSPPLTALLATLALLPGLSSQVDFNVTKLALLDDHGSYSNVWGYVAPDGREYALLGGRKGTVIINATDPVNAYEVAFFPSMECLWRELKAYGRYVYVVNDCSGGVEVIDMLDPEQPVLVNSFGMGQIGHAHTVQIDLQTGKLYACGTNMGLAIFDLAIDPVNPPLVTAWHGEGVQSGPGLSGYSHDLYVKDGLAHVGMIQDGYYAILDVSNLPAISVVSATLTPVEFTHSTWTTADGNVAVTADEKVQNRNLMLWDISNKSAPTQLASLSQGTGTLPHNPYILGNICHVSYYERGYLAFDISDPLLPVKIGEFDTGINQAGKLVSGAWGVYPFQPSGFIYISDVQQGLYVLKLNTAVAPDPSGRPTVSEIWPEQFGSGSALPPTVLLSGATLSDATAVHFGGVTLGAGQFTVLDDQVIAISPPPSVSGSGLIEVAVENAFGTSAVLHVPLIVPGTPLLQSGPQHVAVGDAITHTLSSQPGDTQFLALSLTPLPSVASKVAFAIGGAFSDLVLFGPLPAGPGGTTALPALPIPAVGAGLTIYWQFAALGAVPSFPAPVSNATIHTIAP